MRATGSASADKVPELGEAAVQTVRSFPLRREPRHTPKDWFPACAGMTKFGMTKFEMTKIEMTKIRDDRKTESALAEPVAHAVSSVLTSHQFAERRRIFFEQVLRAAVVIVDGRQSRIDSEVVIQRRVDFRVRHRPGNRFATKSVG